MPVNLAEARRCLAMEDYKTIGKYLCEKERDPDIDSYLQHHIPPARQEQWNKEVGISFVFSGVLRAPIATSIIFATTIKTCFGNNGPCKVAKVELSDGFVYTDILYRRNAFHILIEQRHTDPTNIESLTERRSPHLSGDCLYQVMLCLDITFRFKNPDDKLLSELLEFVT